MVLHLWLPPFSRVLAHFVVCVVFFSSLLCLGLQYGPVFTFTMFGSNVTYCLGSEASAKFWGSHNDLLNAEDLYRNITEPVFGEGIAYAVPHKVCCWANLNKTEGVCVCVCL